LPRAELSGKGKGQIRRSRDSKSRLRVFFSAGRDDGGDPSRPQAPPGGG